MRNYTTQSLRSRIIGSQIFAWGQLSGSSLGLGNDERDASTPIKMSDIDGSGRYENYNYNVLNEI